MKKIWTTAIIIGMLALSMSTVVTADADTQTISPYEYEEPIAETKNMYEAAEVKQIEKNNLVSEASGGNYLSTSEKAPKVKFGGIWGYVGDNETQGYVGGFLGRRGRVGFLKGIWNITDGSAKGRVVGILKHGFFNGKIVTEDGACRITGMYKIDRENQLLHLRWMTVNKVGWAHCRIRLE